MNVATQTLRARLTTVEGKLVEKEFEIKNILEENDSLKETVENISRASVGKSDGESGSGSHQVIFSLFVPYIGSDGESVDSVYW